MSARLPAPLAPPASSGWTVADSLCAVEQLCFDLIQPRGESAICLPRGPAAAACHHFQAGGRRIRARLALDVACRLGMAASDAVAIAAACELLHNASLIHDDLQDRDPVRRGRDTVWKRFGDDVAICTGDLLLSAAYAAIAGFSQTALLPEMLRLVHLRTAAAVQGQCADMLPRSRYLDDIGAYERIVVAKSGALLSLPIELAMIGSGHRHWNAVARESAEHFSVGYQIVDDLEDWSKDANAAGAPAMNAFLVIAAAENGSTGSTGATAGGIALARQHLSLAARSARRLPLGSGALLAELADALRCQL